MKFKVASVSHGHQPTGPSVLIALIDEKGENREYSVSLEQYAAIGSPQPSGEAVELDVSALQA